MQTHCAANAFEARLVPEGRIAAVLDGPIPARNAIQSIRPAWRAIPAIACGLRQKSLTGFPLCGAQMLPQADISRLTWIKPSCGQLCMDHCVIRSTRQ